eukprot:TRINITY_DN32102_c0_g1_i1.p3 TRINITY_DN32102_c0_g1~~TRINITY_DN32102_c0_g1_i1.p3  ORF type:complete len:140 (+),score=9.88 TRINITY_DN32102_c0_g1_i1:59-478(+)
MRVIINVLSDFREQLYCEGPDPLNAPGVLQAVQAQLTRQSPVGSPPVRVGPLRQLTATGPRAVRDGDPISDRVQYLVEARWEHAPQPLPAAARGPGVARAGVPQPTHREDAVFAERRVLHLTNRRSVCLGTNPRGRCSA